MKPNIPSGKSFIRSFLDKQMKNMETSIGRMEVTGKIDKKLYRTELAKFANKNVNDMKRFEGLVDAYSRTVINSGQRVTIPISFKQFAKELKGKTSFTIAVPSDNNEEPPKIMNVKFVNKNGKSMTDKQMAKAMSTGTGLAKAYMMYWGSRITSTFNYYASKAEKKSVEQSKPQQTVKLQLSDYNDVNDVFEGVSLDKVISTLGFDETINIEGETILQPGGLTDKYIAMSDDNYYKKIDELDNDYIKKYNKFLLNPKNRVKLSTYKNKDLFFLDRLFYSASKSGYDDLTEALRTAYKNGLWSDVIALYNEDKPEFIFQYNSDSLGNFDVSVQAFTEDLQNLLNSKGIQI